MIAILILILLVLAAFFLGWLISRLIFKGNSNNDDELAAQIVEREAALDACQKQNESLEASATIASSLAHQNIQVPVAASEVVSTPLVDPNRVDDLKIMEGIGPKIEELLNNAGIKTFDQLASTSIERLKEILETAGPRYQMHDPGTWPQQSALAASGQWTDLKKLQDELNKGKVS